MATGLFKALHLCLGVLILKGLGGPRVKRCRPASAWAAGQAQQLYMWGCGGREGDSRAGANTPAENISKGPSLFPSHCKQSSDSCTWTSKPRVLLAVSPARTLYIWSYRSHLNRQLFCKIFHLCICNSS